MTPASAATDEQTLAAAKARLRREVLARRAAAHAGRSGEAAGRIAALGMEAIATLDAACVSGYWPIRDELDVVPLLSQLSAAGRTVGLPVIEARESPLVFRAWRPGDRLEPRPFGLREPPPAAAVVLPDVLLVPLAAFDSRLYRLGYGGGYYDRTLALYRGERRVTAIGVAFDEQEVDRLPIGPHDEPLDMILTPSGLRRKEA
jgi:5-formyltetrahydrofolate cyclo-ligase